MKREHHKRQEREISCTRYTPPQEFRTREKDCVRTPLPVRPQEEKSKKKSYMEVHLVHIHCYNE